MIRTAMMPMAVPISLAGVTDAFSGDGSGSQGLLEEIYHVQNGFLQQKGGRMSGISGVQDAGGAVSHVIPGPQLNGAGPHLFCEGLGSGNVTGRNLALSIGVIPTADKDAHIDALQIEVSGSQIEHSLYSLTDHSAVWVGGHSPLGTTGPGGVPPWRQCSAGPQTSWT